MSCTVPDEIRAIVRSAAEPCPPGDSVKGAISRAARALGLSYSRARAHWYGLARLIPAEEADALREARIQLIRDRAARLRAELVALEAEEKSHDMGLAQGFGPASLVGRGPDRRGGDVPADRQEAA